MNKRLTKAILLSLCVATAPSPEVIAKEPTRAEEENDDKKEELKELAKKWGWKIIEKSEEISDKANEKIIDPATEAISDAAKEITLYKHDSLWLITDIPNTDPKEQRHYFFVNKNVPTRKETTFYDALGMQVEKNDKSAIRKFETEKYISVSDAYTFFTIKSDYDLTNYTWSTNVIDFDASYLWEEDTPIEYGRFRNISDIIPIDMQKEKYSTKDLNEILEVINDCQYELSSPSLKREIEQK